MAREMPRWVKIFAIVAAIMVTAFAVLHAVGGMGHLTHGNTGVHPMSAEHGNHVL